MNGVLELVDCLIGFSRAAIAGEFVSFCRLDSIVSILDNNMFRLGSLSSCKRVCKKLQLPFDDSVSCEEVIRGVKRADTKSAVPL